MNRSRRIALAVARALRDAAPQPFERSPARLEQHHRDCVAVANALYDTAPSAIDTHEFMSDSGAWQDTRQ
jgi:hypothetical protein